MIHALCFVVHAVCFRNYAACRVIHASILASFMTQKCRIHVLFWSMILTLYFMIPAACFKRFALHASRFMPENVQLMFYALEA